MSDRNDIADALRQRLEADRILGVDALPIPLPARRATADARAALDAIDAEEVKVCPRCGLAQTRTNTVFGEGNPTADIVFVGEAPGGDEDRTGRPFVGRAGQLLTNIIVKGMGLQREDVYICNILKCRPPNNRTPAPDEIAACIDYLQRQLEIIGPQIIIALGAPAAQTLLQTRESIGRLRGRFHDYPLGLGGALAQVMPTYHPAYLLRNPADKRKVWADIQLVLKELGLPIPAARRAK